MASPQHCTPQRTATRPGAAWTAAHQDNHTRCPATPPNRVTFFPTCVRVWRLPRRERRARPRLPYTSLLKAGGKRPRFPSSVWRMTVNGNRGLVSSTQQAGSVLRDRALGVRPRFLEIPTHDSPCHLEPFVQAAGGGGGAIIEERREGGDGAHASGLGRSPPCPAEILAVTSTSVLPLTQTVPHTWLWQDHLPGMASLDGHLGPVFLPNPPDRTSVGKEFTPIQMSLSHNGSQRKRSCAFEDRRGKGRRGD